jgi:hypothetical protein
MKKSYLIHLWQRTPSSADTWSEEYDTYAKAQARIDQINAEMRSMYAPNPADYSIGVEGDIKIIETERAA